MIFSCWVCLKMLYLNGMLLINCDIEFYKGGNFMIIFLSLIIPVSVVYALLMGIFYAFGFDVLGFNLFFVIPVGAVFSGYLMFSKFGSTLFKKNIKPKKSGLLIFILTVTLFFGIQYGQYRMSYLEDSGLNYQFHGGHISEFINPDTGEGFTFLSFLTFNVNNSSINFSRRAHSLLELEGNKLLNWVFYLISFLGFWAGVGGGANGSVVNKQYCSSCKKYMTNKDISVTDNVQTAVINDIRQKINNSESIVTHVSQHPATTVPKSDRYFIYKLHHCDSCKSGIVEITQYGRAQNGKYSSVGKKEEIPVNAVFVTDFLN